MELIIIYYDGTIVRDLSHAQFTKIQFIEYYENGKIAARGVFHHGRQTKIQLYVNDIISFESDILDGFIHGNAISYYSNGMIKRKCPYYFDVEHGDEFHYNIDGTIKYKRNYINGITQYEELHFNHKKSCCVIV